MDATGERKLLPHAPEEWRGGVHSVHMLRGSCEQQRSGRGEVHQCHHETSRSVLPDIIRPTFPISANSEPLDCGHLSNQDTSISLLV